MVFNNEQTNEIILSSRNVKPSEFFDEFLHQLKSNPQTKDYKAKLKSQITFTEKGQIHDYNPFMENHYYINPSTIEKVKSIVLSEKLAVFFVPTIELKYGQHRLMGIRPYHKLSEMPKYAEKLTNEQLMNPNTTRNNTGINTENKFCMYFGIHNNQALLTAFNRIALSKVKYLSPMLMKTLKQIENVHINTIKSLFPETKKLFTRKLNFEEGIQHFDFG